MQQPKTSTATSWLGLTPLLIFLVAYLATSIILKDFYAMPLTVAFLIASVYTVATTRGLSLEKRVEQFSHGAADNNILLMIWLFVLAGAFASGTKSIGSIEATVSAILYVLPAQLLLPGLFLASCLISLAIGTSVGTIVALVPIALGFAPSLGLPPVALAGLVTGGAFFGDNLSFISDTTIAATRSQGCNMRDKFAVNVRIVLPAAIVCLLIYLYQGWSLSVPDAPIAPNLWLCLPYLVILIGAFGGLNVMLVLLLGVVCSGLVGIGCGITDLWTWIGEVGEGIKGMGELIIVTMLAGGMLGLIRYNGGMAFLLDKLSSHISSKRGAELTIATLVCIANVCTANNTISILSTGDVARSISEQYGIDPRKAASILDTSSCLVQGVIPYGAQLMLSAKFASLSPMEIVPYLYYPLLIGICTFGSILLRLPRRYS